PPLPVLVFTAKIAKSPLFKVVVFVISKGALVPIVKPVEVTFIVKLVPTEVCTILEKVASPEMALTVKGDPVKAPVLVRVTGPEKSTSRFPQASTADTTTSDMGELTPVETGCVVNVNCVATTSMLF